ncbi:MAG: hypothetical protein LBP62_06695 [Clostridiales bacterium]|nr:hypothetical protein [Clostridiales bacterium]
MQAKNNIIGKVVELKPDFLRQMFGYEKSQEMKETRPYLVLELLYNGSPQLFAVPFLTNIKPALSCDFWEKLPPRLETKPSMKRGIMFASMMPIVFESVLKIKDSEGAVTRLDETREILFFNIINKAVIRRNETELPEKAQISFEYLRKRVFQNGMSCFDSEPVNKAYAVISREIHKLTYKVINAGLSLNEQGKRPIVEKAQRYLDRYMQTVKNDESGENKVYVDMPKYYTDIKRLMRLLRAYGTNRQETESVFQNIRLSSDEPAENKPEDMKLSASGEAKNSKPLLETDLNSKQNDGG